MGSFFLLVGLLTTVTLVRQNQDIRERAQTSGMGESSSSFTPTFRSSWAFIDTPNRADYAPTAMDDGQWKVWNCTSDPVDSLDTIWYTSFTTQGIYDVGPQEVMEPSRNNADPWGLHTCAPSVVKFNNRYKMYFECAPRVYKLGNKSSYDTCYTELCTAESTDGINWTGRRVLFGINDVIKANIKLETENGKRIADFSKSNLSSCTNLDLNYGVGHPSAVVKDGQIWLWYYDSKGDWGPGGTYLAKSSDGENFTTVNQSPIEISAPEVKYVPSLDAFIGTFAPNASNRFGYSKDGLTWAWPDFAYTNGSWEIKYPNMTIGQAVAGHCAAPAQAGIIGNAEGHLASLTRVRMFSGEGFWSTDEGGKKWGCYSAKEDTHRGSTWAIYLIEGNFNIPYLTGTTPIVTARPTITRPPTAAPTVTSVPVANSAPYFVTSSPLPGGVSGIGYSANIKAQDSNISDTLVVSMTPPSGLRTRGCSQSVVGSVKEITCTISGTPTSTGTKTFTVTVSDGNTQTSKDYTITISRRSLQD